MSETLASVPPNKNRDKPSAIKSPSRKRPLSMLLSHFASPKTKSSDITGDSRSNKKHIGNHHRKETSNTQRQPPPSKPSPLTLKAVLNPTKRQPEKHQKTQNHSRASNLQNRNHASQSQSEPKETETDPMNPSCHNIKTSSKNSVDHEQQQQSSTKPLAVPVDSSLSASSKLSNRPKKNKRFSPYRVRVGCAVAIRYRKNCNIFKSSNSTSSQPSYTKLYDQQNKDFHEIWADPIPDRDNNLALIGRTIRCIFPQSILETTQINSKSSPSRILEGEVLSIVDQNHYQNSSKTNQSLQKISTSQNNNEADIHKNINILLLVDKKSMKHMKFILVADDYLNDATSSGCKISEKEKKHRKYEEQIRGKEKVTVHVTLRCNSGITSIENGNKNSKKESSSEKDDDKNGIVCDGKKSEPIIAERWVIRKKIKFKGHKNDSGFTTMDDLTNTAYMGDENDSASRQQKNWRWFAGTCNFVHNNTIDKDIVDGILFGEVLKVTAGETLPNPSGSENKLPPIQSLATVTLKKIYLPEHTKSGRLPHQGKYDSFTDFPKDYNFNQIHSSMNGFEAYDNSSSSTITNCYTYLVPIEDLFVVSRKIETKMSKECILLNQVENKDVSNRNLISHGYYCIKSNRFITKIWPGENQNEKKYVHDDKTANMKIETCHYCRKIMPTSKMRQCSGQVCPNEKMKEVQDNSESIRCKSWWCGSCCRYFRTLGVFGAYQHNNWTGPCCFGVCNCHNCKIRAREPNSIESIIKNKIPIELSLNENYDETKDDLVSKKFCAICLIPCVKGLVKCETCSQMMHNDCADWEVNLAKSSIAKFDYCFRKEILKCSNEELIHSECKPSKKKNKKKKHSKRISLKCFRCSLVDRGEAKSYSDSARINGNVSAESVLKTLIKGVKQSGPLDFNLPSNWMNHDFVCFSSPITTKFKRKKSNCKISPSPNKPKNKSSKAGGKKKNHLEDKKEESLQCVPISTSKEEDFSPQSIQFHPTCFRTIPYDQIKKIPKTSNDAAAHASRIVQLTRTAGRENIRAVGKQPSKMNDTKKTSRTVRANKRRMRKDIASFAKQRRDLDSLFGREQSLRFGKSLIHGWGVFTDEIINSGDMIIEYRGILIGNAVADKREKEYEKAKIGSDYMFRIDSDIVCDATHQGNLARFINASCTPNCYTQIITVNGAKRIVIYAKKDIFPGEELSYDYKFDTEFDVEKRIPCNCRTSDCRGFLNWNKKYVDIRHLSNNA